MERPDMAPQQPPTLSEAEVSGIVAMAWQDDTPFEAIARQFGLTEAEVIALMRAALKTRSFRVWRMRVRGRAAKHQTQQRHHDHWREHQASDAALNHALADVDREEFPSPPSGLTRQSLR